MKNSNKIDILWAFPVNLTSRPYSVKVLRSTPKLFFLDRVCDTKVTKVEEIGEGLLGATRWECFYDTEKHAVKAYNEMIKEQNKQVLYLHFEGNKREAVEEFLSEFIATISSNVSGVDLCNLKEVGMILIDRLYPIPDDWDTGYIGVSS